MGQDIRKLATIVLERLYAHGNPDKAALAGLRQAASLDSPRAQVVWPILLATLPSDQLSRNGKPTYTETAIYTAMRAYAIHQQGQEQQVFKATRDGGQNLFSALSQMRADLTMQVALDRRVRQLLSITNIEGAVHALISLIEIMKARRPQFTIDYAALAQDLYYFQLNYEQANRVRLQWGEAYYRVVEKVEKED